MQKGTIKQTKKITDSKEQLDLKKQNSNSLFFVADGCLE